MEFNGKSWPFTPVFLLYGGIFITSSLCYDMLRNSSQTLGMGQMFETAFSNFSRFKTLLP